MKKLKKAEEKIEPNFGKQNEKLYFFDLAAVALSGLPQRSGEIVKKRFGLSQEKPKTLEKIGAEYGITRERIRQIVTDSLKNLAKRENLAFSKAEDLLIFTIEKNSGIIKENEAASKMNLAGWREANAIKFFAECSQKIHIIEEKGKIHRCWSLAKAIEGNLKKIESEILEIFEKEKKLFRDIEIFEKLFSKFSGFEKEQLTAYLEALVSVEKNKFGKWGKAEWKEVNPKGTREKVYLILKEEKRPLHFLEIAELIDRHNLSKKNAHPQTVHNELIKDNRFVLIGRGIYALSEWGYQKGAIKDVIAEILEKKGKPMKKEEILEEVLRRRKVKKTTIMINLNNARFFQKVDGAYLAKK